MFPLLSKGAGIFLVFFRLDKDLDDMCQVSYERGKDKITPYDSTYTSRETLCQILSAISYHTKIDSDIDRDLCSKLGSLDTQRASPGERGWAESRAELGSAKPVATLIGTFKDELAMQIKVDLLYEKCCASRKVVNQSDSTTADKSDSSQKEHEQKDADKSYSTTADKSDSSQKEHEQKKAIRNIFTQQKQANVSAQDMSAIQQTVSQHLNSDAFKKEVKEHLEQKLIEKNEAVSSITRKFEKLLCNPKDKKFIAVDNYEGTDSDIDPLREHIHGILSRDAKHRIRPQQLLFGVVLRKEFDIVSMEDCIRVGTEGLKMSEEEVRFTVWYLDRYVGALIYHPEIKDKDGWFGNFVICNLQVVFNTLSVLVVKPLQELLSGESSIQFKETERMNWILKGQFSLETITRCHSEENKDILKSQLIPVEKLLLLLEYSHLLAVITTEDLETMYFIPAILKCASHEELTKPHPTGIDTPSPIKITFKPEYVPIGIFGAMISELVSRGSKSKGILGMTWKLAANFPVKRNLVSFHIDQSAKHFVTLIAHVDCYEIQVIRQDRKYTMHELCSYVLSTLLFVMKDISPLLTPIIAFDCEHEDGSKLCLLTPGADPCFTCTHKISLRPHQECWFAEEVSLGDDVTLLALPFASDRELRHKSLSFEWSKRRPEISGSENELEFKASSNSHFKGFISCEIYKNQKPFFTVYHCLRSSVGNAATPLATTTESGSPFIISIQPKDVCCKPGEEVEFTISTVPSATTYQWYYENQAISLPDYVGQTSERLLISKFLPKHKGVYWCIAEDGPGKQITSKHAALTAEGEAIKRQELQFIGKILEKSAIDFSKYGIEMEHLLSGESDVTYEEMEFVMKLNPSTQVLSINLKREITSRLKEEIFYDSAIQEKVSLTYTKILALGPGQVGKSTFVRRLLGIMPGNIKTSPPETQPKSSTGSLESREACIQYTRVTGAITNKRKKRKWCVLQHELHKQLSGLMSLIVKQRRHQTTPSSENHSQLASNVETVVRESLDDMQVKTDKKHNKTLYPGKGVEIQTPVRSTTPEPISTEQIHLISTKQRALMPGSDNEESYIDETCREFEELKQECSHRLDTMEYDMLFNVADVGGQPAFLEMLPSLTIGPALYLVFMNLKQELSSRYSVPFKCQDSKMNLCKKYSYTSEEVLFSALSSIACFGHTDEQVEKYVQKPASGDEEQKHSVALLVGTFHDEVKNDEIELTNQQLNERLKDTAFYKEGLIYSKNFTLLVNNMSAEDSEIEDHREKLQAILAEKFRKYQIPTQWLMLSICFKLLARNQKKYHVSFSDSVKLGKYLGMDEDMVSVALQFLHKYIGLVMYFPQHENLKKIVICDPQVVFSTISELIFNIYDHNKNQVSEAHYDRFVETGCFSPQDIMLINNKDLPVSEEKKKLLPIDTLVDLLVHLNIAAKVPPSSALLYFLPAVLQTAETDVVKRKQKGQNEELLPEPICIGFKTRYIPLGFVCALVANLTAEDGFNLLVNENIKLYKNMIQFRFQGIFNVTVISLPRYCEFRVTRHPSYNGVIEYWSDDCCPLIIKTIRTVANKVIQSMQHGLGSVGKDSIMYQFAFHCPNSVHSDAEFGQESLAEIGYDQEIGSDKNILDKAMCTKCTTAIPVTPENMVWFGKVPSTPLKICKQPARKGNGITICADGVRPLTYEWLLRGKKLCDGDGQDCEGCSTDYLVIKDSRSDGVFKCQVKDKLGNFVESDELDLFEDELRKTWKLHPEEISKLKHNGFRSISELEDVQLDQLHCLNMGERERMKPLFASFLPNKSDRSSESLCETYPPIVLTEKDILSICDKLNSASKDWFNLGLSLGLKYADLKNIQDQYTDNKRRLTEVIGKRLEITDPKYPVTWPYICDRLRHSTVERNDVADDIISLGLCG